MNLRRIALMGTVLASTASTFASDASAYFDSVKASTVNAAQSSIPAVVAIGTVFIVIAIIVGLLLRAKTMSKGR